MEFECRSISCSSANQSGPVVATSLEHRKLMLGRVDEGIESHPRVLSVADSTAVAQVQGASEQLTDEAISTTMAACDLCEVFVSDTDMTELCDYNMRVAELKQIARKARAPPRLGATPRAAPSSRCRRVARLGMCVCSTSLSFSRCECSNQSPCWIGERSGGRRGGKWPWPDCRNTQTRPSTEICGEFPTEQSTLALCSH